MNAIDWTNVTERDFLEMDWMYARIYEIKDPLQQAQELERLAMHGKSVSVANVKTLYRSYTKSRTNVSTSNTRFTAWDGQALELETSWHIDETGIHRYNGEREEYACTHPLTIVRRIYNIDTGLERLELQYRAGARWRRVIVDKATIASTQKIIELANSGVSVTSDNAKAMVAYLQELEALNYTAIPTLEATSRLGWVSEDVFMPYGEAVVYDGDPISSILFNSVHEHGSEEDWGREIRALRAKHTAIKIVMAASALSPMMRWLNILPSFVHIWSSMSSTGKTVALMAAASFWGDPEFGQYLQSFNATTVALERTAETLNSCPLILDELQLARNTHGQTRFDVYKLAQGLGKGRGTKTGGVERTATWRNTIITSGESPIVKDADGQGAYARVLEVKLDEVIVDGDTGNHAAEVLRANYGHGGLMMVAAMRAVGRDELKRRYDAISKDIAQTGDIQDKQRMFAAGLILADQLACEYVYMMGEPALTVDDVRPHLLTRQQTSVETRALEYLRDWIASNSRAFTSDAAERYGMILGGTTYIVRNIFNRIMEEGGFNAKSVLSSFAQAGLIETRQDGDVTRTDIQRRMDGKVARFVALLPEEDGDELPY